MKYLRAKNITQEQSSPEKSLWAAVVGSAINDIQKHYKYQRYLQRKFGGPIYYHHKKKLQENQNFHDTSTYWLKSNNDEVRSFVWICAVLQVDVDTTREAILRNIDKIKFVLD